MKRTAIVSAVMMAVFTLALASAAMAGDVPKTLNYQGVLTDNTGAGITDTRPITFSLYNELSGGAALWSETQSVTLSEGRFSVELGKTTPIDPAVLTGETYIGVKVDQDAEMSRQKFTSVAYALRSGDVPTGVIVMWSGAIADIPAGWVLCDGANGTPDLRDRFVVGAGNPTYTVGKTGGEVEHTLTVNEMPSHTHIQNAHNHTQNPHTHLQDAHSHGFPVDYTDSNGRWAQASGDPGNETATTASATATNQNTIAINQNTTATNQNTGGGAAHNNLPPYFALCFIMKL